MIKLERWKTVTVKKMVGMVGAKGLSSMNEIFVGMKHLDCGGGYTNLHVINWYKTRCMHKHTHTQTIPTPISWF